MLPAKQVNRNQRYKLAPFWRVCYNKAAKTFDILAKAILTLYDNSKG